MSDALAIAFLILMLALTGWLLHVVVRSRGPAAQALARLGDVDARIDRLSSRVASLEHDAHRARPRQESAR